MDDGIKAIIIMILVLFISLFFFVILIKELIVVFVLILIILTFLLVYTCLMVVTTKWDTYKATKEWAEVEEIKKISPPTVDSILQEQKKT